MHSRLTTLTLAFPLLLAACISGNGAPEDTGGTGGTAGTSAGAAGASGASTGGSSNGGTDPNGTGGGGTSSTGGTNTGGTGATGAEGGVGGMAAAGGTGAIGGTGIGGTGATGAMAGAGGSGGMGGSAGNSFGGASGSAGMPGGTAGDAGSAGNAGSAGMGATAGTAGSAGTAGMPVCTDNTLNNAEVFAHGPTTLYKINPDTLTITTIGDTNCGSSVVDIALDKDGNMYGTAYSKLFKIDKTNAQCTLISTGSYPNSLSFVPAGTVDPVNEALVGYELADYVRIDPVTGAKTIIGSLGNSGYESSGDIVSVVGAGTFLTVKGNGCSDCLVKVDPATGALVENLGAIGYSQVFGLAFWAGTLYGFTNLGECFSYDLATQTPTLITDSLAPKFYGAGSTTCAKPTKEE